MTDELDVQVNLVSCKSQHTYTPTYHRQRLNWAMRYGTPDMRDMVLIDCYGEQLVPWWRQFDRLVGQLNWVVALDLWLNSLSEVVHMLSYIPSHMLMCWYDCNHIFNHFIHSCIGWVGNGMQLHHTSRYDITHKSWYEDVSELVNQCHLM